MYILKIFSKSVIFKYFLLSLSISVIVKFVLVTAIHYSPSSFISPFHTFFVLSASDVRPFLSKSAATELNLAGPFLYSVVMFAFSEYANKKLLN